METSDSIVQIMRKTALDARQNAYCPYSDFGVGAAVLTSSGEVYSGCNVENASYGLSICAERTAVFNAILKGDKRITAVVVVADTVLPTPPCGACRQVIYEFGEHVEIFCFGQNESVISFGIDQLFPHSFGPGNLTNTS